MDFKELEYEVCTRFISLRTGRNMNLTVKAQIPLKAEDIFIGVFDSQEEV
jgi:hypothetical protein